MPTKPTGAQLKGWATGPRGGKYYVAASGEHVYGHEALVRAAQEGVGKSPPGRLEPRQFRAPPPGEHGKVNPAAVLAAKRAASSTGAPAPAAPAPHPSASPPPGGTPVPPARVWVDKLDHLPEHTWQNHFDGDPHAGGQPSPERKALHDRIIEDALAKATRARERGPDGKALAVFTMGGPASGKSVMINGLINSGRFVHIDSDAIKEKLPEYREATRMDGSVGPTAKNAAWMAHTESSYIADRLRDHAMREGMNVIIDGTGTREYFFDGVKHAKGNGYRTNVLMADFSAKHAYGEVALRAEQNGRLVPDHVVKEAYEKIPANFVRATKMVDEATLFDNHGSTRPIWSTRNNGAEETVHDADYLAKFKTNSERGEFTRRKKK